MGTKYFKARRR